MKYFWLRKKQNPPQQNRTGDSDGNFPNILKQKTHTNSMQFLNSKKKKGKQNLILLSFSFDHHHCEKKAQSHLFIIFFLNIIKLFYSII